MLTHHQRKTAPTNPTVFIRHWCCLIHRQYISLSFDFPSILFLPFYLSSFMIWCSWFTMVSVFLSLIPLSHPCHLLYFHFTSPWPSTRTRLHYKPGIHSKPVVLLKFKLWSYCYIFLTEGWQSGNQSQHCSQGMSFLTLSCSNISSKILSTENKSWSCSSACLCYSILAIHSLFFHFGEL